MRSYIIQTVDSVKRKSIPDENETIADDLNLEMMKELKIASANCYYRPPDVCPFNRGNWIIDFMSIDSYVIHCIKLPKEMSEERFKNFIEPLKNCEFYKDI